jgi:hypothetical protein
MGNSLASFCPCFIGFSAAVGGEQENWRGLAEPQKALGSGFGVASINCAPCSRKAEKLTAVLHTPTQYCDVTSEGRNSGARRDVHF